MSNYKDRHVEIRQSENITKLSLFVDELIEIIECYETIYDELKDVVDSNFIQKNRNRTVFLKDIITNTNSVKRDITVIKKFGSM